MHLIGNLSTTERNIIKFVLNDLKANLAEGIWDTKTYTKEVKLYLDYLKKKYNGLIQVSID